MELLSTAFEVGVQYFGFDGEPMSEEEVVNQFGPQEIHVPDVDPPLFRLARMDRTKDEHKVLTVRVVDEDGEPLQGVQVGIAPVGISVETYHAETGPGGTVLFNLYKYDRYSVPSQRPNRVVVVEGIHSYVVPVGWVQGRGRNDWFNPTLQLIVGAPPEPPPTFEQVVTEGLAHITGTLDKILDWLESS